MRSLLLLIPVLFLACRPDGPPPDCPEILKDEINIKVIDLKDGDVLDQAKIFTEENGQKIEKNFFVEPDTELVEVTKVILDHRHLLKIGRNEAEDLKLIGYEIDGNRSASNEFWVELDADGHAGTIGEIEGHFNMPSRGDYRFKASVFSAVKIKTTYSVLVNFQEVFAVTLEGENKLKIIETVLNLQTDSIITLRAVSERATQAYIDYVELNRDIKP